MDNYSSINGESNIIIGHDKTHCTVLDCIRTFALGTGFDTRYECSEYFHFTATFGMFYLIHSLQDGFFSTIMGSVSVYLTMPLIFITWVHNVEWIIGNNGIEKQDRQCAYNVTLRRFRTTTAAVIKGKALP